jgi:arylsulfatase A-like enzyme
MKLISKSRILLTFTIAFQITCLLGQVTDRPNILWIVAEDISPFLGSYGYEEAHTPNLDALAERGIRFTHAYSNGPVCAVARATLLTGMHAPSIGAHQMRGRQVLPDEIPAYSRLMMKAGYYCTNNSKTDYNSNFEFIKDSLWDETSNKAHWKNRPEGKPFFSVFNIGCTHEGQLSSENIPGYISRGEIPNKTRIDPKEILLPTYHPDLPEVRQDWARMHDMITLMDKIVGQRLRELNEEGVADNTIIFFYSDHGGPISRSKRFIYNGGIQVPFIVYLPERWKHLSKTKAGETYDGLVSFVDFPKTLLSIADVDVPEIMQGHVFLGAHKVESPKYAYAYRNRMDEQPGFSRAVTDGRYHFVRNFMPHVPQGRLLYYPYHMQANWRAWRRYFDMGKCNDLQSNFFKSQPVLQLFDLENDRWEVNNLADQSQQKEKVEAMSNELDRWMIESRDIGLIPESMFFELIGQNKKYKTLYEFAQSDDYEISRVLEAAKMSSLGNPNQISDYLSLIGDSNPIIRYWGAYGVFLSQNSDQITTKILKQMALKDDKVANRLMALQSLAILGYRDFAFNAIIKEMDATKNASIFYSGIMAILFGNMQDMLSTEDWQKFKTHSFPEDLGIDQTMAGYIRRLVGESLNK